jgi:hypothetical protein
MLWGQLNEALFSLAWEDNVDTAATPAERAKQFWALLEKTVSTLDAGASDAERTTSRNSCCMWPGTRA